MRRPIPRTTGDEVGGPATPTPTPAITSSPDDEVITPIVDPVQVCDSGPGSPEPELQSATWVKGPDVDTPSSTPNCKTRTSAWHCEAYYTCTAGGDNVVSGGVVADSICERYATDVPVIVG